jgi:hypothetical protein
VIVTFAPTTAAPLGSMTTPDIRPKLVCANAEGALDMRAAARQNIAAVVVRARDKAEIPLKQRCFILTPEDL